MNKTIYPITQHCRFSLGDKPDAWQAWYDEHSSGQKNDWQEVTLPHDWSVSLPFSREYSSGTGYLAGGIGWYRISVPPKQEWKGKRISIVFDGVYKNSRVWCNSYYLGERPNGYISFSYDITDCFSFQHENIICVRVDRSEISDSRWFTGSGITRKVSLVVEEPVHCVFQGIAFQTCKVDGNTALTQVDAELVNQTDITTNVRVTTQLIDGDTVAADAQTVVSIAPGQVCPVKTTMQLDNVRLWSPDTPELYTLVTKIACETQDGWQPDYVANRQQVGIRTFSFDPDKGFFLNGIPTLFKGVCLHHDAGCLGAAVWKDVWRRRLEKLKKMGCNAIRMSHNPHMPELYELCDEMGFLAMDEAFDEWEGPKNKWWQGHNVYPPRNQGYYADFPQWHRQDLTDMVRRDRNHPSIVMWSIGNEIDYPNDPYCHPSFSSMTGNNDANKPAQERQYNPLRPNAERLSVIARQLAEIVRETDKTRPVTLAAAFPELSAKLGFLDALDVAGYNYKEHLYEESHQAFPHLPFIGSENGHTLAAWKAVTDNEYISGQFLWTGIDYLGEAHGWPIHGSGAGLLTLAGFEKTGYYRRQSFWSEKPMVHLASCPACDNPDEFTPVSECWDYPKGTRVLVKCYTNLPEVEISLNGRRVGVYHKSVHQDCISLTLPFEPGVLKASGTAENQPVCHQLVSTGSACQIDARLYTPAVLSKPGLCQLEITMLDRDGNRVYSDASMLRVQVENGELIGLENGDLSDVTDYTSHQRRAYKGQLLAYIRAASPQTPCTVTVTAEGMVPCTIECHTK